MALDECPVYGALDKCPVPIWGAGHTPSSSEVPDTHPRLSREVPDTPPLVAGLLGARRTCVTLGVCQGGRVVLFWYPAPDGPSPSGAGRGNVALSGAWRNTVGTALACIALWFLPD